MKHRLSREHHPANPLRSLALWLTAAVVLFGAAPARAADGTHVTLQTRRTWEFQDARVTFSNEFPGARVNDCTQLGRREFRLLIQPENRPVNNSAWYAFQVTSTRRQTIQVRVIHEGGTHRYPPKISRDGRDWTPLATNRWQVSPQRTELTLELELDRETLWVSAQELVTVETFEEWFEKVATQPYITRLPVGKSRNGRPIEALEINDGAPPNYVFVVGRQHPPEVTGSLGLMAFFEALTVDSDLAERFRARFRVLVVPLMNPDGVQEGQWRHNLGGVDLNRDWAKFSQPETRAVRDALLARLKQPGARPWLFLDFHSTSHDIFYTQPAGAKIFPPGFTDAWLRRIDERFPDYEPRRSGDHNVDLPTSKYWAHEQFGVAAITYEFGDHTERAFLREFSTAAAEEMMQLLLQAEPPSAAP